MDRQSASIRQLVDAGFTPESVVDAVVSEDFHRLEHSGLMSVQLLPPGTTADTEGTPPPADPDRAVTKLLEMARQG